MTTKKNGYRACRGGEGGRTLGFEDASEGAGAGGCVIAAAAGMAGWLVVSECRAGLRS